MVKKSPSIKLNQAKLDQQPQKKHLPHHDTALDIQTDDYGVIQSADIPHALVFLSQRDKPLAKLIKQAPVFDLVAGEVFDPFFALLRSIVYQQLSGKAASTIFQRLLTHINAPTEASHVSAAHILNAPEATLRAAGLSAAKTRAVQDLAAHQQRGALPDYNALTQLSNQDIVRILTQVRGIGPWSVQMMLMFRLVRRDVLPVDDYGVKKGFAKTYGLSALPHKRVLIEQAKHWHPYATIASWYMWRAIDDVNV